MENKFKRFLSLVLAILMVFSMMPQITLGASAAQDDSTITLYFRNDWLWTDVKCYYWGSTTSTNPDWSGVAMTKVGTMKYNDNGKEVDRDLYSIEVPADVTGVIFNGIENNGTNTQQTPDITTGLKDCQVWIIYWDGATKAKSLDELYHTADAAATCGAAQTCTVCGTELNAATGEHTFTDAEGNALATCSVCGAENPDYVAPTPSESEGEGDDEGETPEVVKHTVTLFVFDGQNGVYQFTVNDGEPLPTDGPMAAIRAPEGFTITGWTLNDVAFDLSTPITSDTYLVAQLASTSTSSYVAQIGDDKYETLAEALNAATDGATIELVWDEGNAPIAMNGYVSGKTVTITGTAQVNWEADYLFVGRTNDGTDAADAKLIFSNANLTASPAGGDHGIHVSGAQAGAATKANGAVEIINSNIQLTYLISKGDITLDNSTLSVKSGFSVGGRLANETPSGEDKTATITLNNGSKLVVDNHNGMGLGTEGGNVAVGIMYVNSGSTFECTQSFLVTAKGTMNVNGGTVKVAGTLTNNGTVNFTDVNLNDITIDGTGITRFNNKINFYGTNKVHTTEINGTPFELIVNKGATLDITRFVLGYDRAITVYGEIEDAHRFDPTGKTPSLKFNSTSGVSVGGTNTGNLTVQDAYVELGSSSWKNAYGTYEWSFKNAYVSATSFTNNNAPAADSAAWNVTFDDSVLAAKNYIKNGVGTTYNFTNGTVATTGSLRIDGVMNIDETSSVTTTSQQNNKVGAVDEHGGINGTVNVNGTLTIGSNAKTQLEMLGGELNIGATGKVALGTNSLTLDADSGLTIDVTGMSAGEYVGVEGAVENNGTIEVIGNNKLEASIDENGNIVLSEIQPKGTNSPAYTKEVDGYVRVWGEGGGNASESFVLKLYSGETLIATTQLNNVGGIIDGDVVVTWNFFYPESNDEYWTTTWEEGHPNSAAQPTKVQLWIDGTMVVETDAKMSGADDLNPVVWAELGGVKKIVTGLSGSGTEEDPYLINNLEELLWFQAKVDEQASDGSTQFAGKYFKLTADIDLAGIEWNPIGSMSGDHGSFQGVFDGDNHTISNLNVQTTGNGLGLFARTAGNAEIKNLTLNNVTVKSTDNSNYVGGVVGNAYASTKISNVHVTGTIDISGRGYIGGIAGHGYVVMDNVSVKGEGTISSTFWCAGGILGYGGEGTTNITNATVEGTGNGLTITSAAGGLGAIVGMAEDNNGTQPISGSNLSAKNVDIKTYTGVYGDAYANYALGYLYGGNPTSKLTGTLSVEDVKVETSNGEEPEINDAVATIGDAVYFNLQSAVDAAQDSDTVTLLRDVANVGVITIDKSVTIDLDGKTVNLQQLKIASNITVEVKNGSLVGTSADYDTIRSEAGNLTLTDVNVSGLRHTVRIKSGTATINGGTYTYGGTEVVYKTLNIINVGDDEDPENTKANVTIKAGTFVGPKGYAYDGGCAVKVQAGSTVTIEGGSFSKGVQSVVHADDTATLSITGGTFDQDPSAYVAEGYEATETDGTYTVAEAAVRATTWEVATKEELDAAIADAVEGDTILLTADIDYGANILKIEKAITLDLGGYELTTSNGYGGMWLKNGSSIKNGTYNHNGNTAAIKVWNAVSIEDLVINVGFTTEGKVKGGIVIQENSVGVQTIKNVTIQGKGLTNGIETYNCGNATEPVIGSMENVTINAVGTGMLISAPCGTATGCSISGGTNGIEIWIKGTYSASLDLVGCDVTGGEQAVYAHDEFKEGVVNNGTLSLTADSDTNLTTDDVTLALVRDNESVEGLLKEAKEAGVAKVGYTYYGTLADAAAAIATDGTDTTIKILSDIEVAESIKFAYGTGKVIFTADKPVTIKQTATSDFSFTQKPGVNNKIIVGENVTFELYDNSSDFTAYYGPSLELNGTITGGANWGALYLFQGSHTVSETGKIGMGRVQLGDTSLTVNGEVVTNYLLVENSTFTADGATVNANVIYDNNNGGQRWGASTFNIKNGATVTTTKLDLSYADTVLNIDLSSSLTATTVTGAGKIVVDATGFDCTEVTVITGDLSTFTGSVELTNAPEGATLERTDNSITVKAAEETLTGSIKLYSAALNLQDKVCIIYKAVEGSIETKDEDVAERGVLLYDSAEKAATKDPSQANETVQLVWNATEERYVGQSEGIDARDMDKSQFAVAYLKMTDGTYIFGAKDNGEDQVIEYSPLIYCKNKKTDTTVGTLCNALMQYGAAAQVAQHLMTTGLMNEAFDEVPYDETVLGNSVFSVNTTVVNGMQLKSATMDLKGAISYIVKFTVEESISNKRLYAEYTLMGETGSVELVTGEDGKLWATIAGVAPKDLDETLTVKAYYLNDNGEKVYGGELVYSGYEYIRRAQTSTTMSDADKALSRALAMYIYYADAYANGL